VNRKLKLFIVTILILVSLIIIQTIPVFLPKPLMARELKGSKVTVFYARNDAKGAQEVFELLEQQAGEIQKKLDFLNEKPTKVYVYSKQSALFIRKYGLVTLLAASKWYIGDNKGDQVLLVSPTAKLEEHNHESILSAAIHELVHTINFQLNPKLSYWLDNGVATYLAGQAPENNFAKNQAIPEFKDLQSEDEMRFGEIGGYQYSYTYIEFLTQSSMVGRRLWL